MSREAFEAALEMLRFEPNKPDNGNAVRAIYAAAIERAEKGERLANMYHQQVGLLVAERDAMRAEVAALKAERSNLATRELVEAIAAERDEWKQKADDAMQSLESWMEAQKFSTPNDPTGVRNALRFNAIEAERDAARAALRGVLDATHGCVFCDSGVLRKRVDGNPAHHDVGCPFEIARQSLTAHAPEPEGKP